MLQRPPPFAALRALEAACRHRSYTAAANELNVTHSAVSQAVRRLEEEVGSKLFFRKGSSMEPASASLALAKAYAEASMSVGRAMQNVTEGSPNTVTIKASSEIARNWLTPLLPALALRFPDVSLRVRTEAAADHEVDFSLQTLALSPGGESVRVADLSLAAYASPSLLRLKSLRKPADLLNGPLLIENDGIEWAEWFRDAGVEAAPLRGLYFDQQSGLALEAAIRGAGVALADNLSVVSAVDRGDLVRVCPGVEIERGALYAVWSGRNAKQDLLRELAVWLSGKAVGAPLPGVDLRLVNA